MPEFREALKTAYLQNPCQVLANPLWKTLEKLTDFQTSLSTDKDGVNRLEAFNAESIYVYWRRDNRQSSLLMRRRLESVQLALIHQDFLDPDTVAGFKTWKSYYRLILHTGGAIQPVLPTHLHFAEASLDADAVANFIGEATLVDQWRRHPVLAPGLWVWAMDGDTPVGLAVGEFDSTEREATVEWVQVAPAYQGQGIGRALVYELVRRLGSRASFVTVAGEVEDRDNPGAFFRRCGFSGQDVWWLLART
jgi:GNAT superfamily N-acetyltransferase